MNQRTVKLLRSYSRSTGQPLKDVKRDWLTTPSTGRGEVREQMTKSLWRKELQEFRTRHKLSGKEAADKLQVPYDTWRKWESMANTPQRFVQIALRAAMRDFKPAQP